MENIVIIIADNGGGVTLQINSNYQHYYPQANTKLGEDIYAAMCGDNTEYWEGNEIDGGLLVPTQEEEANNGYKVLRVESFEDLLSWGVDSSFNNVNELSSIFRDVIDSRL